MKLFKKISFIIIFLLLGNVALAQKPWIKNLPDYDKQRLHFGFSVGINYTDFIVTLPGDFKYHDSVYVVESYPQSGLNLGIITNLRLGEYFDLRFVPTLSFASRVLEYSLQYNGIEDDFIIKKVESTFIDLPIYLKFKSERVHNYRFYVLAGGKYTIDLVSQEKVQEEEKQLVKLLRNDYGYEIGVGYDFYFELFKFSPELKFFRGFNNLLVKDDLLINRSIDKLHSQIFTISFNFE
ncbi:MAG: porin family protein [Bacteroidia bacterium]